MRGSSWSEKATRECPADPKLLIVEHWTKWDGEPLIKSSEPWDKKYAHKPWIIKHDGVVYHFYCAVGDQGRVIALATSEDLKNESKIPPEQQAPRKYNTITMGPKESHRPCDTSPH